MHGDAVEVTPRVHVSKIELLDVEAPGDFKWHGGQLAPNGYLWVALPREPGFEDRPADGLFVFRGFG